jgi:hypothetical protein
MPVVLIPINPADQALIEMMTRASSPRWMRVAACLALEGRRLVMPKNGHPVIDVCQSCGTEGPSTVRAFHKDRAGEDAQCVVVCDECGAIVEDRSLETLEQRRENPLKGIRDAF